MNSTERALLSDIGCGGLPKDDSVAEDTTRDLSGQIESLTHALIGLTGTVRKLQDRVDRLAPKE